MKLSVFENMIRKVVREEIDYALKREIKELKESIQSSNHYFKIMLKTQL